MDYYLDPTNPTISIRTPLLNNQQQTVGEYYKTLPPEFNISVCNNTNYILSL